MCEVFININGHKINDNNKVIFSNHNKGSFKWFKISAEQGMAFGMLMSQAF